MARKSSKRTPKKRTATDRGKSRADAVTSPREGESRKHSRLIAGAVFAVGLLVVSAWWGVAHRHENVDSEVATPAECPEAEGLKWRHPFDGAVFPADIAPALFWWSNDKPGVGGYRLTIAFSDGEEPVEVEVDGFQWRPSVELWEEIKRRTTDRPATATIAALSDDGTATILEQAEVHFETSPDPVEAPIFYREVNLPFIEAVEDPAAFIRWRYGPVSSVEQPPIVLEKLPLCGNCHSFSADGKVLGMDVDYASDKGSYVISPVSQEMVFDNDKIITWSDYKPEDNRGTLGLLSQVSPDGRYVVSTVKDRSVFAAKDDFEFSQLFFPIQGILAYYDRETKTFHALPGADDPNYVQTNATWSPDGKYIVFAKAPAYFSDAFREKQRGLTRPEDIRDFLSGEKTFKFELWRVPFNGGKGGKAEPLAGASGNGMSNYFPKYSPDGRWIVFCRAKSFMLLQPDSELWIIPAEGGEARRLECNTSRMNSWHSWSPNGKWLVFSSKALSPYTQLFLTHIDEEGHASVPVVLDHFTAKDKAANIPEFVNNSPDAIRRITAAFVDDQRYYTAGTWNLKDGEYKLAAHNFRKAIELNPDNIEARVALGTALIGCERFDEAELELRKALERDPKNKDAYWLLGTIREKTGRDDEAMAIYREAIRKVPDNARAYHALALVLLRRGEKEEARRLMLEAAHVDPTDAMPLVDLGHTYAREGRWAEAAEMYRNAIRRDSENEDALSSLAVALLENPAKTSAEISEAVTAAEASYRLTGGEDPSAVMILTRAYAAAGRIEDAVKTAYRALSVAEKTRNGQLAIVSRRLLEEYRGSLPPGTPYPPKLD